MFCPRATSANVAGRCIRAPPNWTANAFLDAILAGRRTGVAVVDQELRGRVRSRRAEGLWGLRAEEVVGQHLPGFAGAVVVMETRETAAPGDAGPRGVGLPEPMLGTRRASGLDATAEARGRQEGALMPTPLSWHVDDAGDNRVVTVRGDLDQAGASGLRLALMKVLTEQPAGVLVDVAGMTVPEYLALSVFGAVVRQAGRWPGIPVLLCAPSSAVAALLARGAYRLLPTTDSVRAGAAAIDAQRTAPPAVTEQLLPIRGASRLARDMATDVCARWELQHLMWPASLVASELVSNAAQHARTMLTLRFARRPRHLLVSVADGSQEIPVMRTPGSADLTGGRGLLLVQTLAAHWGSLPTEGGKVVWASLPTEAPAA